MLAVEPLELALEFNSCANGVPAAIVVDAYVISLSQVNVSPSVNVLVTLSDAFSKKLM